MRCGIRMFLMVQIINLLLDPQGMTDAEIVIYTGGCGGFLELCELKQGEPLWIARWGIPAGTQVWIASSF